MEAPGKHLQWLPVEQATVLGSLAPRLQYAYAANTLTEIARHVLLPVSTSLGAIVRGICLDASWLRLYAMS